MKLKDNQVIAGRISTRKRTTLAKKLAARGLSPEHIAKKIGQSVEWVHLTLEDFDPKKEARNNEQRKARAQLTTKERGSRVGRPPKEKVEKKSEEVESTPVKDPLTVEKVLARYKQIRMDYKAGRWGSIEEAAKDECLDLTFITRLIKGKTPVD